MIARCVLLSCHLVDVENNDIHGMSEYFLIHSLLEGICCILDPKAMAVKVRDLQSMIIFHLTWFLANKQDHLGTHYP